MGVSFAKHTLQFYLIPQPFVAPPCCSLSGSSAAAIPASPFHFKPGLITPRTVQYGSQGSNPPTVFPQETMLSRCGGPGYAERGSGCVRITATGEQSETI